MRLEELYTMAQESISGLFSFDPKSREKTVSIAQGDEIGLLLHAEVKRKLFFFKTFLKNFFLARCTR